MHPTSPTDRLDDLGRRLAEARARLAPDPVEVAAGSMAQGFRLGLELVSGVLVGAGVGFWLDRRFETTPVFLLIFFMLGLAAGFTNLFRAVKRETELVEAQARGPREL